MYMITCRCCGVGVKVEHALLLCREGPQSRLIGSSRMRCLRMWCLIIIVV